MIDISAMDAAKQLHLQCLKDERRQCIIQKGKEFVGVNTK